MLRVGDASLLNVTFEQAMHVLRTCKDDVTLLVNSHQSEAKEVEVKVVVDESESSKAVTSEKAEVTEQDGGENVVETEQVQPENASIETEPKSASDQNTSSPPLPPPPSTEELPPPPTPAPPPEVKVDPRTVAIEPGVSTVIEIAKGSSGLGLSVVGGVDTALVSVNLIFFISHHYFLFTAGTTTSY